MFFNYSDDAVLISYVLGITCQNFNTLSLYLVSHPSTQKWYPRLGSSAPLSLSHTGSYDCSIVRLMAIWPRYDQSAMFATISICDRIQRLLLRLVVGHRTIGGTRARAITNDWRRSIARSIVGNRATSGGDQRPIVPPIVRSCNQSGKVVTDRTTVHEVVRQVVPPIVRSQDQLHDQSCDYLTRDHARLVVRPCATGGTTM